MQSVIDYLENETTKQTIIRMIGENLHLYQGINTEEKIQSLTGSLYNYLVMECVQNNQYISLSKQTIDALNALYRKLVLHLRRIPADDDVSLVEHIVAQHRVQLIAILRNNTYNKRQEQLFIPCAEYTGLFQYQLLHLDECVLKQPLLDVGCGRKHQLLSYLKEKGFSDLFGIDQYQSDETGILCSNWFEYHFLPSSWGTILAHMSFSNHFRRSLITGGPEDGLYRRKYQEILDSLFVGGCFIYTPAIKTVEATLDASKYSITCFVNLEDRNLDTVCIRKIRE